MSDRDLTQPADKGRNIPPVATSETSTLVNPTGSWKYIMPRYEDRVAPCNAGCPVGNDIEGYMYLIGQGRITDAANLLVRENPMPAVTGRVCHHPCEHSCNRASLDEPVAINSVERRLGDMILAAPPAAAPERTRPETVAVVGSGVVGAVVARLRPRGMALALGATAAGGPRIARALSDGGGPLASKASVGMVGVNKRSNVVKNSERKWFNAVLVAWIARMSLTANPLARSREACIPAMPAPTTITEPMFLLLLRGLAALVLLDVLVVLPLFAFCFFVLLAMVHIPV